MGVNYGMTEENLWCHLRTVLQDRSHGCLGIRIGPCREGERKYKDGVRLDGKRLIDFPAHRLGLRDAEEVD